MESAVSNQPLFDKPSDSGSLWSVPAIIAIVLGLCSGPIMVGLLWLTGIAYGISMVGSGIAVIVGAIVAIKPAPDAVASSFPMMLLIIPAIYPTVLIFC